MSSGKEKTMKRKLFGGPENDERVDASEKKRRRKNVEVPKHYPLSERQQLALLMQMTSAENSPEPANSPPPSIRRTPGGSGRKDKIHRRNERGETLLHLSTIKGDLEAMKELIKQGAEVNVKDFAGWTPLHEACNHGHHEITRYLLEVGANVNSKGLEDDTPLHDAVTNAHKDLVELLLKHGANPLLSNKSGQRPLDIADNTEIRELMKREVMSSDDSDSSEEEEKSCNESRPSVDKYKEVVKQHKGVEKVRTTSTTSSSSRELFKSKNKVKRHKANDKGSTKPKSSYDLVTDTADSDDSDTVPLIQKKAISTSKSGTTQLTPHANGYKQKAIGKTPTLTATPVSSNSKTKPFNKKVKSGTANKTKALLHKSSPPCPFSSDYSSDSDNEKSKISDRPATSKQTTKDPNYISSDDQKPTTVRQKSLISLERNSGSTEARPSQSTQIKRVNKTHSSEDEAHLSKVKNKPHKGTDTKARTHGLFTPFSKAGEYHNASSNLFSPVKTEYQKSSEISKDSTMKRPINEAADDSVYDFSLLSEDFTDVSEISLKHNVKSKDTASDLFDSLCLGKSSDKVSPRNESIFSLGGKRSLEAKRSETVNVKPHVLSNDAGKELSRAKPTNYLSPVKDTITLDRNSNEINPCEANENIFKPSGKSSIPVPDLKPCFRSIIKTDGHQDHPIMRRSSESDNSTQLKTLTVPTRLESRQLKSSVSAPTEYAKQESVLVSSTLWKQEVKLEKSVKEKPSSVPDGLLSIEKHTDNACSINPDAKGHHVDTEAVPSNVGVENMTEKNLKDSSSVVSSFKDSHIGLKDSKHGLVKKKKKHKHQKAVQEIRPTESKDGSRRGSSDSQQLEPTTPVEKDSSVSKSLLEKVQMKVKSEVSKSAQSLSRKSSQENKNDSASSTSSPLTSRKKSKPNEVGEVPVSKSTSKSCTTTQRASKSVPDKQHSATSANSSKKDKNEPKKIALVSDKNSFFLSELEKSSRQRDIEKLKQKRKKKLLLKQKMKVHKTQDASTSVGSEKKLLDPPNSITQPSPKVPEHILAADRGRPTHMYQQVTTTPVQGQNKDRVKGPGISELQTPPQVLHLSMQNLREHDRLTVDTIPTFPQVFNSPSLSCRSLSQTDDNSDRLLPEKFSEHEKRNIPVHRSLSFPAPPSEVSILPKPLALSYSNPDNNTEFCDEQPLKTIPSSGNLYNFTPNTSVSITPTLLPNITQTHPPFTLPTSTTPVVKPVVPISMGQGEVVVASVDDLEVKTGIPHSAPLLLSNVSFVSATSTNTTVSLSSSSVNFSSSVQPLRLIPRQANLVDAHHSTVPSATDQDIAWNLNAVKGEEIQHAEEEPLVDVARNEAEKGSLTKEEFSEVDITGDGNDSADKEDNTESDNVSDSEKINEEAEHKLALEKYVKDRLSKFEAVIEEPMPKRLPVFIPMEKLKKPRKKDPILDHLNVYEEWGVIQKQINERRKKHAATVIPQAPQCYWEYMTFTGGYLLSGSRESWLSVPVLAPPPSLTEEMQALFVEHEKERVKLRLQHATQREKLIVACEQEIMRVHSRAARTHQNQLIPLSACSVLLDREVYNVERRNTKGSEGDNGTNRTAAIRDRFNARMFISWLDDVDDKYEKMKNALLSRQRHEAQALHAVQRTEWLLKLQEVEQQGQQRWTSSKPEDVTQLYVPLVNISDDFELLPA